MSLITDSAASPTEFGAGLRSPWDPARTCAIWASSGEFEEYVVYERPGRWTFAGGVAARIVLTAETVTVTVDGKDITWSWLDDPATPDAASALAAALRALEMPQWQVFGRIDFDFCAATHGLAGLVPEGGELAHLIVARTQIDVLGDMGAASALVEPADADPAVLARLMDALRTAGDLPDARPVAVDVDDAGYRDQVAAAVAEIDAGRYQKVIMSREVTIPFDVDMPATYARARTVNRPMRSYLLDLGGAQAAGFSPELVCSVDAERVVITEPLAGTRACGRSPEEDAAARAELLADPKEITEHAVSVRACFAEIESVAAPATTAVTEFMAVRERGTVQHLASTVTGRLADDADPWRALGVLFPSITASGIPKAPALEAIYRLESAPRALYAGAVMTATSTGELEAALVLRSVYAADGRAWLRSGAGVVAASRPDREFTETCEKLAGLAPQVVPVHREQGADKTARDVVRGTR